MERQLEVGTIVIWHDSLGKPYNALVTIVWNPTMVNLVYMSDDVTKTDPYGRQIERATSCMHKTLSQVHGYYWRWPDEEPNPYQAPQQR